MKNLIVIVFISNLLLFAQTSKEEKLEWIKSRGDIKVTEEGDDIYRLEYPGGRTLHFNFGKTEASQTDSIPTTVIETWNVDTMLYKDMYYFWQEVPVTTATGYEMTISDMNENGLPEIYGRTRDYEDPWSMPMRVYELNAENNFDYKMIFSDSLVLAKGIYDVNSNGENNLMITSLAGNAIFYKNVPVDPFTLLDDFVYYRYHISYPGQIDHPELRDFDGNGKADLLFYDFTGRSVIICEYNANINNFNLVKEFHYSTGFYSGFAVGDFDLDGKTGFVYGGIDGKVYVIENNNEHNYSLVWESEVEGFNAYWQIFTNDIDGNGKPEFWVASTTYYGLTDVTRYTCFEYTGDNEYQEKHRIDFVGVFPLYAMNGFAQDVDNDGNKELVLCIGDNVFIMQYSTINEKVCYKIFYMTKRSIPGAFTGVTMYDFDVNGYEELLIHMSITRSDGKSKRTTHLFKPDFAVPVVGQNESVTSGYSLEQNYPNPFNPVTTISYYLPERSYVSLKVFDILGNEIETLINEEKQVGSHRIEFDGNNLTSGIYFYKLKAGDFTSTKKLIILK